MENSRISFNKYFSIACWVALIAYLILYVVRIIPWITTVLPNDMHEFSTVNVVYKILDGVNPYQLNTFIESAYVYGITMPALGAFLYSMIGFGMNLTVFLRLLSLVFILASSVLVAMEIYSTNKGKFAVLLGFTITLVIGWWTSPIIVTTNTMGVFFMLLTFYILRRYTGIASVLMLVLLSLLCFYTKPYFLFVVGMVCIWLFLTSKRNLIIYSISFLILGGISVVLMNHYFPLYFYITLYTHQAISGFTWDHTLKEWAWFLLFYFPLFILVIYRSIVYFKTNKLSVLKSYEINDELFYIIYIVCASIVLIKLGGHWGAHITYFYHLLLPIITIYGLTHIEVIKQNLLKSGIYFGLLLFSVYHIVFISSLPIYREEIANSSIDKVNYWMSAFKEKDILVLTQYAGPYERAHNFGSFYSSHMWQLQLAKNLTETKNSALFPIHKQFIERITNFENEIVRKINRKEPKMIITTGGIPEMKGSEKILESNYKLVDKIDIPAGRMSWSYIYVYIIK